MKEKFKPLVTDQFTRISLLLSLLFIIPLIILIFFTFSKLPPYIPFFNSMPWGEERLFSSKIAIFLPAILLVVFTMNVFQAVYVYKRYALVARIVMFNSFLFLLLSLLAYLQILFLSY